MGDEVLFLCGLMIGVPREQVEDLGRSCGATSICPLHHKWLTIYPYAPFVTQHQDIITHAAYIIPFGISATMRFPPSGAPLPMPGWLLGFEWELAIGHLPCFALSPRSPTYDLGTYEQKNVDWGEWVEGLHQLILSVSLSPRRAAGSQPRVTA